MALKSVKAVKAAKPSAPSYRTSEYKGNLCLLMGEGKSEISMGYRKIKSVLDNLDDARAFCADQEAAKAAK